MNAMEQINNVFFKTGDADAPPQILDGNGEVVHGQCVPKVKPETNAADILADMAKTYRERNAVYGDNYKMVGKMMAVLFPNGVSAKLLHSDQFHLFELKLVKLSRFAISGLTHSDSIHDDAVYSAMIEMILQREEA